MWVTLRLLGGHKDTIEALFRSGVEVESYRPLKPPIGLKIGQVLDFHKIEGSNKLKLCRVLVEDKEYSIVCGGSNVREGMKTIVALPGSKVLGGTREIKDAVIFKTPSQGMLCSWAELYDLDYPHEGIADLEDPIGSLEQDLSSEDVLLELLPPVNRKDLNSVEGLIRELRKQLDIDLEIPNINKQLLRYVLNGDPILTSNEAYEDLVPFKYEPSYLERLLSIDIYSIIGRLQKHDFTFKDNLCYPPKYRPDLKTQGDLSEEILNIHGWENLTPQPIIDIYQPQDNRHILAIEEIKEYWRNRGFYECNTYNLGSRDLEGESIEIDNPMSQDHCIYSYGVIDKLIEIAKNNRKFKNKDKPLFEVIKQQSREWALYILLPQADIGFPLNLTWIKNDIYDIQSLLKRSLKYINQEISYRHIEEHLEILDTQGYQIGEIRYKGDYLTVTVDLPYNYNPKPKKYIPRSKYPAVFRDLSIEIPNHITLKQVLDSIKGSYIQSKEIREIYPALEHPSVLIRIRLQSHEKTLLKEEINQELEKVYRILEGMGVKIR